MPFTDFYSVFQMWLASNYPAEQNAWNLKTTLNRFPRMNPVVKGLKGKDKVYLGNITMDESAFDLDKKYVIKKKQLELVDITEGGENE